MQQDGPVCVCRCVRACVRMCVCVRVRARARVCVLETLSHTAYGLQKQLNVSQLQTQLLTNED